MSSTGALPIWITIIQEGEDDMASFVTLTLQPSKGGTISYKTIDNPKFRMFQQSITPVSAGDTFIETLEWDFTQTGESSAHIQATANNPLLCYFEYRTTGVTNRPSFKMNASDTLDTADGTAILSTAIQPTGLVFAVSPIPIILNVNQFLTPTYSDAPSGGRAMEFNGFTVELPTDYVP